MTPGGIPAIVDQDLFDRVQQRFEQNRIAHGRPAKEDVSYLLIAKLFLWQVRHPDGRRKRH